MICFEESEDDNLQTIKLHKHEVVMSGGGVAFTFSFIIDFKRRKWCDNG